MKIISKYKDYYDYLIGINGVDPKLVLDRRNSDKIPDDARGVFIICGKIYEYFYFEGKFYMGDDLLDAPEASIPDQGEMYHRKFNENITMSHFEQVHINHPSGPGWYSLEFYDDNKDWNLSYDCPILLITIDKWARKSIYKFPPLMMTPVPKYLDAQELWVKLSNWLSQKVTRGEQSEEPMNFLTRG